MSHYNTVIKPEADRKKETLSSQLVSQTKMLSELSVLYGNITFETYWQIYTSEYTLNSTRYIGLLSKSDCLK